MQHMEYFNIAIDGPAGAGKSTIAKLAAEKLGFVYVDTGAMYRSMALYFIRQGISPEDEEAIARACSQVEVAIRYADGAQQVILNGEDVSGLIRSEEVGRMASATSVYGPVRQKLVQLQKQLAREADVIMDGRDIGTCVLPDAPAKIYLTASVETRARRRFRELEERGGGLRYQGNREGYRGKGLPGHAPGELAFKAGGRRGAPGFLPHDHRPGSGFHHTHSQGAGV